MLNLGRTPDQGVTIFTPAGKVRVVVCGVKGNRISVGFEAPHDFKILRDELLDTADEPAPTPAKS